jgi:hypothetical protein
VLVARIDEVLTGAAVVDGVGAAFTFDGLVWTLCFGGRTVTLPDAKGLHDLHQLIGRPGQDVSPRDLMGGERSALGADPVLDEVARRSYARRLDQLDEQIASALERDLDAAAAELDRERAALLAELGTATGLSGRRRRLGDEGERARKAVTGRIRDALRRLDERHPELAAHLRDSVTTGQACRYAPAQPVPWRL